MSLYLMLWVIIFLRFLRCNEPHVSWQMEHPFLFFIKYINMTNVCVTEPDVIRPYYLLLSYGSWCYYRTMWVSVGSPASGVVGCYLSFSCGDLTSTSSHMCGSWYLLMFLFRDGSLTLINIASLMALAKFWSSLQTMLKLCPETVHDQWCCALWTFLQIFCLIPQCTPLHSPPCQTCICRSHHFSADDVPIFGVYQEIPDGIASSELHFNPMFSADVLAAFTQALIYGTTM